MYFMANFLIEMKGLSRPGFKKEGRFLSDKRTFTTYILTWRSVEKTLHFWYLTVKSIGDQFQRQHIIIAFFFQCAFVWDRLTIALFSVFCKRYTIGLWIKKITDFAQFFLYFGEFQKTDYTERGVQFYNTVADQCNYNWPVQLQLN
jgi:hypothetical protein